MKKSILFSALALGMGLFSCSQEDLGGNASQESKPVTVTVQLPDDALGRASSRYIPNPTDDEHQLRCILYVSNSDGSWTERIEKVASEAVNGTFSFTFTPDDPDDYKCAFWADFISATDQGTGTGNEKRYTDLYYGTQNLPTVSYNTNVTTDGSLFNNDDCDAYSGTIPAGGALSVELKRPFAKVSIYDSGETTSSASSISVIGYGVYGGFNIETGTVVDGEVEISCTDITKAEGNTFFFNYLFVGERNKLPDVDQEFSMTVDGTTKTVSTDNITLTPNTEIYGGINWGSAPSDGSITISVDFDSNWIDPNAPKVGDYYYSDGTWSTTLDGTKTAIGVIFAVPGDGSAIDNDVVVNYSDVAFTENEIHGWVVGLKDVNRSQFSTEAITSYEYIPNVVQCSDGEAASDDIKGYANSKGWLEYTLPNSGVYTALQGVASYELSAPATGTSGWYLPAFGQLKELANVYMTEGNKVLAALTTLGEGNADVINTGTSNNAHYWSSTAGGRLGSINAEEPAVQTVQAWMLRFTGSNTVSVNVTQTDRGVRPILTF